MHFHFVIYMAMHAFEQEPLSRGSWNLHFGRPLLGHHFVWTILGREDFWRNISFLHFSLKNYCPGGRGGCHEIYNFLPSYSSCRCSIQNKVKIGPAVFERNARRTTHSNSSPGWPKNTEGIGGGGGRHFIYQDSGNLKMNTEGMGVSHMTTILIEVFTCKRFTVISNQSQQMQVTTNRVGFCNKTHM